MKEFVDDFSWSYEDIKIYETDIIQDRIPLNPRTKPFKQKLRHINPILLPIIENEVKNLLDAKIIVPLRYFDWVENLVPIWKKNGEIRLHMDFRYLNRCSLKDNYPLPKMDHILQKVVGSHRILVIDGFVTYLGLILN